MLLKMAEFCGLIHNKMISHRGLIVATDSRVIVAARGAAVSDGVELADAMSWPEFRFDGFDAILQRLEAAAMCGDEWQPVPWRACEVCNGTRQIVYDLDACIDCDWDVEASGDGDRVVAYCADCCPELGGKYYSSLLLRRLQDAFGPLEVKRLPGNPPAMCPDVLCFRAAGGAVFGGLANLVDD